MLTSIPLQLHRMIGVYPGNSLPIPYHLHSGITPWFLARGRPNLCRLYNTPRISLFYSQIKAEAGHRDERKAATTPRSLTLPRCLHTSLPSLALVPPLSSDKATRRAKFEQVYTRIVDELVHELKKQDIPEDAVRWYRKNLDYNLHGGKRIRGMTVVDTLEILKRRPLTDDEYSKAAVLGWCIEMFQAYFLVADDIMDAGIIRRGQPCWYRNPEVGMIAVNDSFMISSSIYRLIRLYFKKDPCYVNLVELFLEAAWRTESGQLIDSIAVSKQVGLSKFSLEKHSEIAILKTAFYSLYVPVACAMYMCGISHTPNPSLNSTKPSKDPYDIAKSILIPLGEYGQAQDDFIDFAGTPEHIGKIGTDIINNKCSWCINIALLHASPDQRRILEENYGRGPSGGPSELAVKKVFDEIDIRGIYVKYEEKVTVSLREKIVEVPDVERPDTLRREVFETLMAKLYKRSK